MKFGSSSLIGLAIGDREIACVQIAGRGARRRGARAARFDVPAELSLDQPESLGTALRVFLDAHRMAAKRAVLGLPARWLLAEPRELPPASRDQALASLRLQAERIAPGDDAHLVFDVAGTYGNQRPGQVLLVALSQDRLDRLKRMCAAAALTPTAVTATGLVVAQSLKETADQAVILFSGEGAELVLRSERGPRAFRHLSGVRASSAEMVGAGAGMQPLTNELWRAVALGAGGTLSGAPKAAGASGMGSAGESASPIQRILLLGDSGVSGEQCSQLAGRLGRKVDCMTGLSALRHVPAAEALNGQSDHVAAQRIWPALALAGAAARSVEDLPVNFLRPKLAPPRVARVSRTWALGIATAAAVVLGIGVLWWQAKAAEAQMLQLETRLKDIDPEIQRAKTFVGRVNYARGFFETRPAMLDCLSDLAESFGREDRIWTTGFSMRENGRGQLQGRAADQQAVLALLDRLRGDASFTDVRLNDMREATAESGGASNPRQGGQGARSERGEIGFSLSFAYVPQARPAVTP